MRFKKLLEKTKQAMVLPKYACDHYEKQFAEGGRSMSGPEFYSSERKRLSDLEIVLRDLTPIRFKSVDGGPLSVIDADVTQAQCEKLQEHLIPGLENVKFALGTAFSTGYETDLFTSNIVAFENGAGMVFGEVAELPDPTLLGTVFSLTYDRAKFYSTEKYVCNMEKDGRVVEGEPCAVYLRGRMLSSGLAVENCEGKILNIKFQPGRRPGVFTENQLNDHDFRFCRLVPARKRKLVGGQGPYR